MDTVSILVKLTSNIFEMFCMPLTILYIIGESPDYFSQLIDKLFSAEKKPITPSKMMHFFITMLINLISDSRNVCDTCMTNCCSICFDPVMFHWLFLETNRGHDDKTGGEEKGPVPCHAG